MRCGLCGFCLLRMRILIVYLKRPFAFLMNAVGFAPPICCLFFLSLRSFMMKFVVSIEILDEICL